MHRGHWKVEKGSQRVLRCPLTSAPLSTREWLHVSCWDCCLGRVRMKLEGTRGFHLYLCRAQSQVVTVLCAVNFREACPGFLFQPGGAAAVLKHKRQEAARSGPARPCTSSVLRKPLCRQRFCPLCCVVTHSGKFQGLLPTLPPTMIIWAKFYRNNKIMQDKSV